MQQMFDHDCHYPRAGLPEIQLLPSLANLPPGLPLPACMDPPPVHLNLHWLSLADYHTPSQTRRHRTYRTRH